MVRITLSIDTLSLAYSVSALEFLVAWHDITSAGTRRHLWSLLHPHNEEPLMWMYARDRRNLRIRTRPVLIEAS